MTQRMHITLRFTVDLDGHRYRPTQAEVAQELLEVLRYEVGRGEWVGECEVEPDEPYDPGSGRSYDWAVTAADPGDAPGETSPCGHCGQPVDQRTGSGRQRRYCTDTCRQAAHRARRRP